ncbi:MAG: LCP family protein [Clostridia bacterium]|nr:LCP family protein [Clostridia bacterium]
MRDDLPYTYIDEDEGKRKKKKSASPDKRASGDSERELPYVYLDDEKPAKKKKAASGRAAGDSERELPYVYLDEEEKPKKKKSSASGKASARRPDGAKARDAANRRASSASKAGRGSKKKKSAVPAVLLSVLLVLVSLCGAAFALDYFDVYDVPKLDAKQLVGKGKDTRSDPVRESPKYENDGYFATVEAEGAGDGLDAALGGSVSVSADELDVTAGLDPEWMNILLLGADRRVLSEPCRTDTMMICSVNTVSGEVKLTSIMRDTAVSINGRTTRINSAYFLGEANLAMKTVNRYFGMNITKYVFVDFDGFASIASQLGGIDMDISEAEMKHINHNVAEQYHILINQKKMDYDSAEKEYYETELKAFGKGIHLNGMQTLGYARIRKLDGGDYERTRRQRDVLNALLGKAMKLSASQIIPLVTNNIQYCKTNLDIKTIYDLAGKVLSNADFSGLSELRLPANGTYKDEKRGEEAMLYDMDVAENTKELHRFIYGK